MRINLTKKDIVNSLYMQLGFSINICENLLEDFLSIILDNLIKLNKVKIAKFGTFTLRKKSKRTGRNPKNSESVQIPEKNVIKWKMSKIFFNRLNKNFTENEISDTH